MFQLQLHFIVTFKFWHLFLNLDPLDEAPTMKRLLMLLKPIAGRWEVLGMSLEVNTETISGPGDITCLGKVLTQWKTSCCSPYTWRNIIEVIEDILEEKLTCCRYNKGILKLAVVISVFCVATNLLL